MVNISSIVRKGYWEALERERVYVAPNICVLREAQKWVQWWRGSSWVGGEDRNDLHEIMQLKSMDDYEGSESSLS